MKVAISYKSKKKNINFWLPNSVIKTKVFWRWISNDINLNNEDLIYILRSLYKQLKKYVKQNGHFYLITIKTNDGKLVTIKM